MSHLSYDRSPARHVALLLLVSMILGRGAAAQDDGLSFGTPKISPDLELHTTFNGGDLYGGLHVGIMDRENRFSLTAFLDSRLFRQKVLIQRPEAYYQFHEWRGMTGLMLDKGFFFIEGGNKLFGAYLEGLLAYSWGSFRASDIKPASSWQFVPGVGIGVTGPKENVLKLGVRWTEVPKRDIPELHYKIGYSLCIRN